MKTVRSIFIFFYIIASFLIIVTNGFADWEDNEVVNKLLSIQKELEQQREEERTGGLEPKPISPVIYGNSVIFASDSGYRRMGVAFAHENFTPIYWFSKLLIPQDRLNPVILPGQKTPDPFKDSGMQFYIYKIPELNMNGKPLYELEYRLIINGLWTTDPANHQTRRDPVSGLSLSVLTIPQRRINEHPLKGLPEGLRFTFYGPPGETVTVAGSFNAWDPFIYELKEYPAGTYSITIPLPPGTYQYVFFNKGQRLLDENNPRRAYMRNGTAASEVVIP